MVGAQVFSKHWRRNLTTISFELCAGRRTADFANDCHCGLNA
jgi:hypothetical protein